MLTMLGLDPGALMACRVEDIVAEGPMWTEREWQRYLAERTREGPVALRKRSGEVMPASARAELTTVRRRPGPSHGNTSLRSSSDECHPAAPRRFVGVPG